MAWNGYRASEAAGGGMLNGYATPKAKQEWTIGAVVNVGFLKGLVVVGKDGADWVLESSKGKRYGFQPHMGIYALTA